MKRYAALFLIALLSAPPTIAQPQNKKVSLSLPGASAPQVVRPAVLPTAAHRSNLVLSRYPSTHYQRGLYYKQHGDLNRALVEFLKSSQENPRLIKAFYEQALIFRQRGYLRLAESSLGQALAVQSDYHPARVLLATIRLEQGDIGGAIGELSRSLGLPVQTPAAVNHPQAPSALESSTKQADSGNGHGSITIGPGPPAGTASDGTIMIDNSPATARQSSIESLPPNTQPPAGVDAEHSFGPQMVPGHVSPATPATAAKSEHPEGAGNSSPVDDILKGIPGIDPSVPLTPQPGEQGSTTPAMPVSPFPPDKTNTPANAHNEDAASKSKPPKLLKSSFHLPGFSVPNINPLAWFGKDNSDDTEKKTGVGPEAPSKHQSKNWLTRLFENQKDAPPAVREPVTEQDLKRKAKAAENLKAKTTREQHKAAEELKEKSAKRQQTAAKEKKAANELREKSAKKGKTATDEQQDKVAKKEKKVADELKEKAAQVLQEKIADDEKKVAQELKVKIASDEKAARELQVKTARAEKKAARELKEITASDEQAARVLKVKTARAEKKAARELKKITASDEQAARVLKVKSARAEKKAARELKGKTASAEEAAREIQVKTARAEKKAARELKKITASDEQAARELQVKSARAEKKVARELRQKTANAEETAARELKEKTASDKEAARELKKKIASDEKMAAEELKEKTAGDEKAARVLKEKIASDEKKAAQELKEKIADDKKKAAQELRGKIANSEQTSKLERSPNDKRQKKQSANAADESVSMIIHQQREPEPIGASPIHEHKLLPPSALTITVPHIVPSSNPTQLPRAIPPAPPQSLQEAAVSAVTEALQPLSQLLFAPLDAPSTPPSTPPAEPAPHRLPDKQVLSRPLPAARSETLPPIATAMIPQPGYSIVSQSAPPVPSLPKSQSLHNLSRQDVPARPMSIRPADHPGPQPVPTLPQAVNLDPPVNIPRTGTLPAPQVKYSSSHFSPSQAPAPTSIKAERFSPTFPGAVGALPVVRASAPTRTVLGKPQPATRIANAQTAMATVAPRPWYSWTTPGAPSPPPAPQSQADQTTAPKVLPARPIVVKTSPNTPTPQPIPTLPQPINTEPSMTIVEHNTTGGPLVKSSSIQYSSAQAPAPTVIKTERSLPTFPDAVRALPVVRASAPTKTVLSKPQPAARVTNTQATMAAAAPKPWYSWMTPSAPPLPAAPKAQTAEAVPSKIIPAGPATVKSGQKSPAPQAAPALPPPVNIEPSMNIAAQGTSAATPKVKYSSVRYSPPSAPVPAPTVIKSERVPPNFPGAVSAPPTVPPEASAPQGQAAPAAAAMAPVTPAKPAQPFQAPHLPGSQMKILSIAKPLPAQKQVPLKPAAVSPGIETDPWVTRLKYLEENGTASLKDGEAFMFSEESGEATLFLQNGQCIKRHIMPPRDHEEVVQQRRPDILIPKELMYNLSLLGKLLPHSEEPSKPAEQSAFSIDKLDKPDGMWGWLKQKFKF